MKRLATENINTPEHFDRIWGLEMEGTHYFDRVRMEAFTDYVRPGMRVLDVGAGVYGWSEYLLSVERNMVANGLSDSAIDANAIDFSPVAVATVKERCPSLKIQLGDALRLPFPDADFDLVGSGELIEHMEVPGALVAEMARVTKPGGLIIIGTVDPNCPDAIAHGVYPEHLWEFTPDELLALVSPYGAAHYKRVGNYDFVYCRRAG